VNGVTFSTIKERGPICEALMRYRASNKPEFGRNSVTVRWDGTEVRLLKNTEKQMVA